MQVCTGTEDIPKPGPRFHSSSSYELAEFTLVMRVYLIIRLFDGSGAHMEIWDARAYDRVRTF